MYIKLYCPMRPFKTDFTVIAFLQGRATHHMMPCSDNIKQFLFNHTEYIFKPNSFISLLRVLFSDFSEHIFIASSCKHQNEWCAIFGFYFVLSYWLFMFQKGAVELKGRLSFHCMKM